MPQGTSDRTKSSGIPFPASVLTGESIGTAELPPPGVKNSAWVRQVKAVQD